ncbi:MAG: hypothetical protein E7E89_02855 [Veillonella sp.]|nr:hypothetical protein [Veillonella sp.]
MAEKRVVYLTFSTVGGKSNKVILGAGDAELAAFTTAREVKTQTTELQ